jgi:hypothetical protein
MTTATVTQRSVAAAAVGEQIDARPRALIAIVALAVGLATQAKGGRFGLGGWVGGQAVPFDRMPERLVQTVVDLADGEWVQAAGLAVSAAFTYELVVELLDMEGPKRSDRSVAEVGSDVVFQQLAVAADGPKPDRAGVVEVGKPAVQQLVHRRPSGIDRGIGGRALPALVEGGIQRCPRGGPGPVAAQVVELAPVIGSGAFDARVPAQAAGRAAALGLVVALQALALDRALRDIYITSICLVQICVSLVARGLTITGAARAAGAEFWRRSAGGDVCAAA